MLTMKIIDDHSETDAYDNGCGDIGDTKIKCESVFRDEHVDVLRRQKI